MMDLPTSDDAAARFSTTRRAMHWLTVLLLMGSFALVWAVDWLPPGQNRAQVVGLHRTIGLLVLSLTLLRLLWSLASRRPSRITMPRWPWAAGLVQALLIASMLAIPLLGWTYTNARGHAVLLFGQNLPSLIFKDQYFSRVAIGTHEFLAYALLALIGLHVAAALWHHLVLRDATLKRMWRG
jgi:cytochrome b561